MSRRIVSILAVGLTAGAAMFMAAEPAEAGRRTGTWKYSPGEIYAYQRAMRQQQWQQRRGYGNGYGRYAPAPRGYGYGYYRQRPDFYDDY